MYNRLDEVNMKRKQAITYIICFILTVILSFAKIKEFTPLSVGLCVALTLVGLNGMVVSTFAVAASCIEFSVASLVYSAAAAVVCIVFKFIAAKKKMSKWAYVGAALLSQVGLAIYSVIVKISIVNALVCAFLSLVFACMCYMFAVPCITKRFNYKFLDSEIAAGGVIIAAVAYGLTNINFPLAPFFFSLSTLISVYLFGLSGVASALCFALGYCAGSGTELFGAFALMALCAYIFMPAPRAVSAASMPLACILYTCFFSAIPSSYVWWLVSLTLGGAVFVTLPRKGLARLKEFFTPGKRNALRALVDRSRYDTGRRLSSISEIFNEMSVMMDSERRTLSDTHLEELTDTLVGETCALCRKYDVCLASGTLSQVKSIMLSSMEKGGSTISNIPDGIKSNCTNLASLLSAAGKIAVSYGDRMAERKNINGAKQMLSVQMKGISDILSSLALKEAEPLCGDENLERRIAEELTYRYVVTEEALVFGEEAPSVMLTVRTETLNFEVILSSLKRIFNREFVVEKTEKGVNPSTSVIYLTAKPLFDVVFSAAAAALKDVSGDTHSFIKINDHTFMMALCDGMGNGERAAAFSSSTISLIENFYKAGFSHKLALKSVNDFLSVSGEEIYATVDIAVVNLLSGDCDIIKIGSPPSYIKTADTVLRVEGQALPIGVLEEMRPSVLTYTFKGGETLVFASDGIASSDALIDVINNGDKFPQPLCRRMVDFALKQKKADDCTAVAFHIFKSA